MNTHMLKPGDRVRVTTRCPMHGYQAGDKGTVRHGPKLSSDGTLRYYHVAMDKDLRGRLIVFTEGEIEPDV